MRHIFHACLTLVLHGLKCARVAFTAGAEVSARNAPLFNIRPVAQIRGRFCEYGNPLAFRATHSTFQVHLDVAIEQIDTPRSTTDGKGGLPMPVGCLQFGAYARDKKLQSDRQGIVPSSGEAGGGNGVPRHTHSRIPPPAHSTITTEYLGGWQNNHSA